MAISYLTLPEFETSIRESNSAPSYLEGVQYDDFTIKLETSNFLYEIKPANGQKLPTILLSKYTSPQSAKQAIDSYMSKSSD